MRSLTIVFLGLYSVLTFVGCKKFVEIASPPNQLLNSNVFQDDISAAAAVTYIYTNMMNNGDSYSISAENGLLGDELQSPSANSAGFTYYTNAMLSANSPGPWTNGYHYIYEANVSLAGIQGSTGMSEFYKQQLMGECKFIRAFWLFYLTNCYGSIPLVLGTDYSKNISLVQSSRDKVYQQVISDLQDAKLLLSTQYIDASDMSTSMDRVRPTKWAAMAFLARVYLYALDNSDAILEADSVIANSGLFSLAPLSGVFLANSSEAIWQLMVPQPSYSNNSTPDGGDFILGSAPGLSLVVGTSLSKTLLNSFETGDNRATQWVGSYITTSAPIDTFYFPYKYRVGFATTTLKEYEMVFRLGEQYLIRAEAEAKTGDLGDAISDLNIIRARAGLPNTLATSQSDLIAAVDHERRVEMFTEWGCRWFDLIRTGAVQPTMSVLAPQKGGIWSQDDTIYPIPSSEILIDPNLKQNNGYQ